MHTSRGRQKSLAISDIYVCVEPTALKVPHATDDSCPQAGPVRRIDCLQVSLQVEATAPCSQTPVCIERKAKEALSIISPSLAADQEACKAYPPLGVSQAPPWPSGPMSRALELRCASLNLVQLRITKPSVVCDSSVAIEGQNHDESGPGILEHPQQRQRHTVVSAWYQLVGRLTSCLGDSPTQQTLRTRMFLAISMSMMVAMTTTEGQAFFSRDVKIG